MLQLRFEGLDLELIFLKIGLQVLDVLVILIHHAPLRILKATVPVHERILNHFLQLNVFEINVEHAPRFLQVAAKLGQLLLGNLCQLLDNFLQLLFLRAIFQKLLLQLRYLLLELINLVGQTLVLRLLLINCHLGLGQFRLGRRQLHFGLRQIILQILYLLVLLFSFGSQPLLLQVCLLLESLHFLLFLLQVYIIFVLILF